MNADLTYFELINQVLKTGKVKKNRTGVNTVGCFGAQARFNLSEGFPLLTTKKVFFKGIVHELLWFLSGSTNIKYLVDNNVHIWDEWAYKRYTDANKINDKFEDDKWMRDNGDDTLSMYTQEEFIEKIKNDEEFAARWGELGEGTYGGMWRGFPFAGQTETYGEKYNTARVEFVDQISKVVNSLKNDPDSRRHIVSAWHPYWVDNCALPPCHVLFQFHTELTEDERIQWLLDNDPGVVFDYHHDPKFPHAYLDVLKVPKRRLNCQLYQRSCDVGLGLPFNIASYSLLTVMMAQVVNMVPGDFVHSIGDLHIYLPHVEALQEQMSREPKSPPQIKLNPKVSNLFGFKYEDIELVDYESHPPIKMEVAV